MTPPGLIDPEQFPFRSAQMDPAALETAASTLRRLGRGLREAAGELVGTWRGVEPAYRGPGQERVYAMMAPVAASTEACPDTYMKSPAMMPGEKGRCERAPSLMILSVMGLVTDERWRGS